MTIPNQNTLAYLGKEPVKRDYTRSRNPTPKDNASYEVGDTWVNSVNNTVYVKSGVNALGAVWTLLGGAAAAGVTTINSTAPDGAGNFNITSTNGLVVTPGVNSIDITLQGITVHTGTGQTVGASTIFPVSVDTTIDGGYNFFGRVVGVNTAYTAAYACDFIGGVRTLGGVSTIIGTTHRIENDPPLNPAGVDISGGGPILLKISGVGGQTINWTGVIEVVFVS